MNELELTGINQLTARMSDDAAARILRRDAEEIADRVYAEFGCEAGCGIDGIVKIVVDVLGRFPGRTEVYRNVDLDAPPHTEPCPLSFDEGTYCRANGGLGCQMHGPAPGICPIEHMRRIVRDEINRYPDPEDIDWEPVDHDLAEQIRKSGDEIAAGNVVEFEFLTHITIDIPIGYISAVVMDATDGAEIFFDLDKCPTNWDAASIPVDLQTAHYAMDLMAKARERTAQEPDEFPDCVYCKTCDYKNRAPP